MVLKFHQLKPAAGSKRKSLRRGRGDAAGQGSFSGRGQKGQKARSGGRKGLKLFGLRRLLMSTPKLRGFRSPYPHSAVVNLESLEKNFSAGVEITPTVLRERGLLRNIKNGVKILGKGELTKRLVISGCAVSASAKEKILKAGGSLKQILK